MKQLWVSIHPGPLGARSRPHPRHHWAPSWAPWLCSGFPLAVLPAVFACQRSWLSQLCLLPPLHSTLFSTSASLFPPCTFRLTRTRFFDSMYVLIYSICLSLSDLLHSVRQTLYSSTSLQMTQFCSFYGWVIFHSMYVSQLLCFFRTL